MTKVVLIRHGRSTANADGVLAGRAPGVALDEVGREQARALAHTLAGGKIVAAYSSPIQRCIETAALAGFPDVMPIEGLSECDYGDWTGAKLDALRSAEAWADIQSSPSGVCFPGGETMQEMFNRTTSTVADLTALHQDGDTIVVFSHGDPIKAIIANAFGMPLDDFQRVHVNPAGISIIDYSGAYPMVLCVNAGGDVSALLGSHATATVGGGDVASVS